MKRYLMIMFLVFLFFSIFINPAECGTKDTGAYRGKALVKIFNLPYDKCYSDIESLLRTIPQVSIYAKDRNAIALYYINPNTTPVGIFFTEVDAAHTKVEVASASLDGRDAIAKVVFSGDKKDAPAPYVMPDISM